jgi:hypothetical protein
MGFKLRGTSHELLRARSVSWGSVFAMLAMPNRVIIPSFMHNQHRKEGCWLEHTAGGRFGT